jgi:GAF domain-containing protein
VYSDLAPDRDVHALDTFVHQIERSENVSETLEIIASSAVTALPEIEAAGVSVLAPDGVLETIAASDPVVARADAIQQQVGEGPLYVDEEDGRFLVSGDLATEPRWPAYGRRLVDLGLQSLIAVPLRVRGKYRAALTLYARQPHDVSSAAPDLVEMFAAQAAIVIDHAEAVEQLSEALRSRKVIGQALGLVMGKYGMNEEQAFAYVRRISQDRNVKLREVCAQMVADFDASKPMSGEDAETAGG